MRVLALALALLLSGCALLRPSEPAAPPPPPPAVRLEVHAPDALKRLLDNYLDLGRLSVLAPGEPISETELLRLVAAAPAQARSLLETEGYFNAEVRTERPQADLVVLHVEPGPRVTVDDVRIEVRGPLAAHTERGDRGAQEAQRAMRNGWGLPTGAPFRNRDWANAKNAALAQLRAHGYVAAHWVETRARIDAQASTAQLELVADSGPLYRIGALEVQGLQHHDEKVIRNLAGFGPGAPATEQLLLDYQERLQNTNLFERVSVQLDDDVTKADAADVTVRVSELKLQQATVGVGVSANVGPRVSLEHVHRKVFGLSATARNKIELGRLLRSWEGEIATHPGERFYRNILGWTVEREESSTDVVTTASVRVGRSKDTRLVNRFGFVELERSLRRTDAPSKEQANALSVNYHLVWRRLDSVVLPTDGYTISLQGSLGQAHSSVAEDGPFVRAYGRLTGYWPLAQPWYATARVEAGQVFVRDGVLVPESKRFRAGGDDSVRGYAYRSLGPMVNGVVNSGTVLFTTSAEVARPLSQRLPSLWGAFFIDAGQAADRWGDLKPVVGYGAGLRWRSPVGPLRVDVAYGQELHKLRLHLSVGVAF